MTVPSEARYVTLAAPTGGLNAFDSLAAMQPQDAVFLNNMVPYTWGVQVRKGYVVHARGLAGHVHSLLPWLGTPPQLWAVAGGNLYDVTASVDTPAPVITGLSDALWHHVAYATSGGQYTVAVNGDNDPILFTGVSPPPRLVAGDGTAANTIAGIDPKKFVQVTSHQRRLWFVEKDSTVGWYLPTDAIYGTAKPFDFGPMFKRGGKLRILSTWTVDDGEGANDHLVAISDNGDCVVYAGTDVDTAEKWDMKSVYYVGTLPAGRRLTTKIGGDLIILSTVGLVSLSTLVTSTQVNVSSNDVYSKKVQLLLSATLSRLLNDPYWQVIYTPNNNLMMVNIPRVYDGGAGQLVANQVNLAWCLFSKLDSCCWLQYKDLPFFGSTNGTVNQGWTGYLDGANGANIVGEVPEPIRWRAQQAYNYFDAPALQKQVGMVRLNFLVGMNAEYATEVYYDFNVAGRAPPNLNLLNLSALWDEAIWDQSFWSGDSFLQRRWELPLGMGIAASIVLGGVSVDEVTWVSTDLSYKTGGLL